MAKKDEAANVPPNPAANVPPNMPLPIINAASPAAPANALPLINPSNPAANQAPANALPLSNYSNPAANQEEFIINTIEDLQSAFRAAENRAVSIRVSSTISSEDREKIMNALIKDDRVELRTHSELWKMIICAMGFIFASGISMFFLGQPKTWESLKENVELGLFFYNSVKTVATSGEGIWKVLMDVLAKANHIHAVGVIKPLKNPLAGDNIKKDAKNPPAGDDMKEDAKNPLAGDDVKEDAKNPLAGDDVKEDAKSPPAEGG